LSRDREISLHQVRGNRRRAHRELGRSTEPIAGTKLVKQFAQLAGPHSRFVLIRQRIRSEIPDNPNNRPFGG